jgi:hypothetical protein
MPVLADPQGWFTLQVPDGWEPETDDCVTTLRSPVGIGVLYLSGGRHAGGRQKNFGGAEFLARFLRSLGMDVEATAVAGTHGVGCRIYSYHRESDGALWRYWSVTDDETALLISYTCDARWAATELIEVDAMIRSVRLFHSAPVH